MGRVSLILCPHSKPESGGCVSGDVGGAPEWGRLVAAAWNLELAGVSIR